VRKPRDKIFNFFFISQGFFFYKCGVLVNLKNKGVLLSGVGRGRNYFLGGVGWLEKKGGILFVSLFSFLIIW
jgi:hypothetical protein